MTDLITRLEEAAAAQPLLLTRPPQPTALAMLLREAAQALRAMRAASLHGSGSSAPTEAAHRLMAYVEARRATFNRDDMKAVAEFVLFYRVTEGVKP